MRAFQAVHALRLAWRGLRRTPGTSAGAVLTLGVSFVAVVVLLGVLQGARRELPVPEGREVVRIELRDARAALAAFPAGPVAAWARGPGIEAAAALRMSGGTLVRAGEPALRTSGAAMEPAAFRLLALAPALGRWPTDDPQDANALVLGWDSWQQLGADAGILGAEVRIDGVPHTVVGVMPERFGFPEKQSYWTVLAARDSVEQVVARLSDGATIEGARAALDARLRAVGEYRSVVHAWNVGRGEGGEAAAFAGLGVLVAVLVVICAANVSTLLLVRAAERAGPLAVHAALGAPRAHIALVLFLEALLVALAGGVVGVLAGAAALAWIESALSVHWGYYWMRMELQPAALAGVLAVVVVAAAIAGTAPALGASRIDLREVLAHGGRGGSGRRRRWLGRGFVWAQVSLSTIGLVAALLLGRGVMRLGQFSAELPLDRVATATITPTPRTELAAVRAELLRIPGVRAASISAGIPGMDHTPAELRVLGDSARHRVGMLAGDPGLLATYGVRLVRGRNITEGDVASAPPVALVTTSFAERYLGGRDPMGARVQLAGVHGADVFAEVVGVVADWYPESTRERARVIVPLAQAARASYRISVSTEDPGAVVPQLRAAVAKADPELAAEEPQTLRALTEWLLRMPRVLAGFGMIGGLAGVLVAAIGLYGVISFQVRSRLAEMGVRMALGAAAPNIVREVLREAVIRVAPGVVAGSVLAWGAVGALGVLAGGSARSPLPFAAAVLGMIAVALLASLGPALRAAKADPLAIMRRD